MNFRRFLDIFWFWYCFVKLFREGFQSKIFRLFTWIVLIGFFSFVHSTENFVYKLCYFHRPKSIWFSLSSILHHSLCFDYFLALLLSIFLPLSLSLSVLHTLPRLSLSFFSLFFSLPPVLLNAFKCFKLLLIVWCTYVNILLICIGSKLCHDFLFFQNNFIVHVGRVHLLNLINWFKISLLVVVSKYNIVSSHSFLTTFRNVQVHKIEVFLA